MTPPQKPEPGKHCEHECVCQDAIGLIKLGYRNINQPCNYEEQYSPCLHDTRQRNVPGGLGMASTNELIGELSKREGVLIVGHYPRGAKLGYLTTKEPTMLISVVEGEKP